jgi:hypothetical protein
MDNMPVLQPKERILTPTEYKNFHRLFKVKNPRSRKYVLTIGFINGKILQGEDLTPFLRKKLKEL